MTASLDSFHEELRQRSLPVLIWSACLFNTAYMAWCGFDYLMATEHFRAFLWLRMVATATIALLVGTLLRRPRARYAWEAFFLCLTIMGGSVAYMLAHVHAGAVMAYAAGFTLVIYGAGLLPSWPPRWAIASIGTLSALAMLPALLTRDDAHQRALVAACFLVTTSAGLSLIVAYFKYSLARRDFATRRALSELAEREHAGRVELDKAGKQLRDALAQLKELDRLKSQFFANISHELRTPLTLILPPVENLRRDLTSLPHSKNLAIVQRNAERLLRLIDELLELSRLDAGGLRLTLAELDLRMLASTVLESAQPAAQARGIELTLSSEAHPLRVIGDAHRLEMVLSNLLGNALKFTPSGGSVQIKLQGTPNGAELSVHDTGNGIAEQDLPHVFERFFQAGSGERRRNFSGVGIGLSLAKELTELHGGRLTVASQQGMGSVFTLHLPYGAERIRPELIERRQRQRTRDSLAIASEPANANSTPRAGNELPERAPLRMRGNRRARIVLAEDNDELRQFIAELLAHDYDVRCAENGAEALSLIRERRPDLIISDVMMPELSGAELCAVIKRDAQLKSTPIILLTARVGSDATLEGYAHGADDFVGKPFHPEVLLARVRAQLSLRKLALDLAEREKLAAVGTLSAGILHEVRNPLNAILNAARVLSEDTPSPELAKRLLHVVGDCAQRIHGLTQSLEAQARPADGGQGHVADVTHGVEATLALLGHRLHDVKIERSYGERRSVRAPAGPVNQVFLNLLDNALHAGARSLHISTRETDKMVEVRIADDGPGVPVELRDHIFDAFVTGAVQGSGLGLYLSRCITEQHGGTLILEESAHRGASFVVSLPRGDA